MLTERLAALRRPVSRARQHLRRRARLLYGVIRRAPIRRDLAGWVSRSFRPGR